jgi:hypothetical protein
MNGSVLAASPGMSEARSVWTYEAAIAECSPNKRIAEAVSNVGVKNRLVESTESSRTRGRTSDCWRIVKQCIETGERSTIAAGQDQRLGVQLTS